MVAALGCGATAYWMARQSDAQRISQQRTALRDAVSDFSALFGQSNEVDPRFVRMIEQSVGLKNLKFEADPVAGMREMQPVIDAQGRIVGFFTFELEHPMTQAMERLLPLLAGVVACLVAFASVSLSHLRRARNELAASKEQARQSADGHKPNDMPQDARPPDLPIRSPGESAKTISGDEQFVRRELPRAMSAGELELHYQPIVAAQGGRIVGVEALLRWNNASRGQIPPATFIPIAEQMGLMDELGGFVLRRALIEAARWPEIYVSVNLSPVQVRDHAIVDLVRATLAETGVAPNRLMLEVTEGVLIDNPDEMLRRIRDLRLLGVRIALDDFGSGYSSLGYLQRFPFDKLKIDKSFVSALGRSSNGGVIVQAIVALGRALGVSVVVEGVETEEQRVLLRLAGCDEMQGFLFAKPGPAKAIDRLLWQPRSRAQPPRAERLSA